MSYKSTWLFKKEFDLLRNWVPLFIILFLKKLLLKEPCFLSEGHSSMMWSLPPGKTNNCRAMGVKCKNTNNSLDFF